MTMRFGRVNSCGMVMPMVLIMIMLVIMREAFVRMLMLIPFREMQPHADTHQRSGNEEGSTG